MSIDAEQHNDVDTKQITTIFHCNNDYIESLLPPEFCSGNDIAVERSTITRERMKEIIRELILNVGRTYYKNGYEIK